MAPKGRTPHNRGTKTDSFLIGDVDNPDATAVYPLNKEQIKPHEMKNERQEEEAAKP